MTLTDAHQHLWNLQQFPCSWCAGLPALNRSFLLEDYLAAAGTAVSKSVFVECDVDSPHQLDEARHIQHLAERHPSIAGIVAAGRPENDTFAAHLEQLAALPRVRGVRRVLHVVPDEVSQAPLFIENIRRLADYDFTFDVCILARQLPLALQLIRCCPEVSFILDHCGGANLNPADFPRWSGHLRAVAALPNVVCKISGVVAFAPPGWQPELLRPWLEHTVACFGWERVLWASDWPVCTLAATFQQWLDATREIFRDATREQQEALFSRNADRAYKLKTRN